MTDTVDQETEKSNGLSSFLKKLSGYYCQFLETDFKRIREPKRKIVEKNGSLRIGIPLSSYPDFKELLVSKLDQKTPASFLIRHGRYSAKLSSSITTGINAAINSVDTSYLAQELDIIRKQCFAMSNRENLDFEASMERFTDDVHVAIDKTIVQKVIQIVKPSLERQSGASAAIENIETFSDEIVSIILENHLTELQDAFGKLVYSKDTDVFDSTLGSLADASVIRSSLNRYFEGFATKDLFVELREMISSFTMTENSQFYLNIGEVKLTKSKFPLYFLPMTATIESDAIRIEFGSSIYANKKAVEYVLGQMAKNHGAIATNPINERIFHKQEDQSYIDVMYQTFHKVLAAFNVEGNVDLKTSGITEASRFGMKVNNGLNITLSDKSDESILNDYEALMSGLAAGDPLLESFKDIVESFLTGNPVSIDDEVEREWANTAVSERLVFQSPLPLAEEQRKVLSAIRNDKTKFINVEGPPGTGKSHTITAIAFELILKQKNILILSDKKEALDVVEAKLNDVISKVRGDDADFVNPILRLGKTDSNYSNIIKNSSIDKLKTSVQTFKSNEGNYKREFSSLEAGLKDSVTRTVKSVEGITFKEIDEFHKAENELLQKYEALNYLDESCDEQLLLIYKALSLFDTYRHKFSVIGKTAETSSDYIRLAPALGRVTDDVLQYLVKYPNLDINNLEKLPRFTEEISSLRKPIIGYLFSGAALRDVGKRIEQITGEYDPKPQLNLSEYATLSGLKSRIESALAEYGGNVDADGKAFVEFLKTGPALSGESLSTFKAFTETTWNQDVLDLVPCDVPGLLGASEDVINLLSDFSSLLQSKQILREKFDSIPDFDYLKGKTQFEQMNALSLVNIIDERVTDFATNYKADAKTLQQIIRSKAKFPLDKFDVLRKAFPCMIAGLRDFAEFVPLQSDLFDLVIIDEASQVSIAQALPAILRAKKVLVLGDRRQFGNVKTANASKQVNQGYFQDVMENFRSAVSLGDESQETRAKHFNITHSVMDFFEFNNNFTIQLKKHFRGYPEMISFSSKYVYSDGLQALKIRGKPIDDVLEFVMVENPDAFETLKNTSKQEADLIFKRLEALLELDEPPSVAIVTPFRDQVTYIQQRLADDSLQEEYLNKLKLAVFTFDTCQGEERDVIFYSLVGSRQSDGLNYIFPKELKVSEDEVDGNLKFQRLNVGFSRGKEKLVFVHSKPLDEFSGSIKLVLKHYEKVLQQAKTMPSESDVDASSPMEAKVLEWLKSTSFVNSRADSIEIIPQFELGAYLKALNPTYRHPNYKVDFLIRYSVDENLYQCVVEYDGFEFHFDDRDKVNAANWQSYLTSGDVERECVLESFGYKMLRINRFNVGKDPIQTLDKRLNELFAEFEVRNQQADSIEKFQSDSLENIKGLSDGTHKKCSTCGEIKPLEKFYDPSLVSNYGRTCRACKSGGRKKKRRFF